MKVSARNVFNGPITALTDGPVNAEVELTLAGGDKLVAIVTEGSVQSLGLAVGKEAIAFVKARPRPLALYLFTGSGATEDAVLARTHAGSVCINHVLYQVAQTSLPFGGIGPSGMGAYHGKAGFDTFTHHKPVLRRPTRLDPSFAYPPFPPVVQRVLKAITRW